MSQLRVKCGRPEEPLICAQGSILGPGGLRDQVHVQSAQSLNESKVQSPLRPPAGCEICEIYPPKPSVCHNCPRMFPAHQNLGQCHTSRLRKSLPRSMRCMISEGTHTLHIQDMPCCLFASKKTSGDLDSQMILYI